MRRDLPPHRFGEACARVFLLPREAEEEALELDAVVERRGREVLAAQSFVERHGDSVHQRDYSGHDRNPRVAEGVHGLVAPSRQQFVRRRGGDVSVSVTGWGDALRRRSDLHGLVRSAHPGAPSYRGPRRQRRSDLARKLAGASACAVRDWGRRRNRSRCAEIHWISRLWPLVVQPEGW